MSGGTEENHETSVRIDGQRAEILTRGLTNTELKPLKLLVAGSDATFAHPPPAPWDGVWTSAPTCRAARSLSSDIGESRRTALWPSKACVSSRPPVANPLKPSGNYIYHLL
jgi:hypothetical protein